MNLSNLTSRLFLILIVLSLSIVGTSCIDTETVDQTPFAIYYSGMTDIGPSMSANISAPTYLGSAPSNFTIFRVSLNDAPVNVECFSIDAETGSIAIRNTNELEVGIYQISVSCVSNGKTYEFKNAVSVNMMRPVPEGIKVEPNYLTIDYADLKTSTLKAKVTTEGEHVSISQYRIAEGDYQEYFSISATGEVSINTKYNGDILPGIYKVSLVLKTEAGEGIFTDAVTFNITSKPLALTYAPNTGKMEEETANPTSYTTSIPTLKGSLEGVVYSIANVTPATDKFIIDAETGVISVLQGHGLKAGDSYSIDVNVRNNYNTAEETGKVFENAFTLEVVGFIAPIENFKYNNETKTQSTSFVVNHTEDFIGDEVTFTLENVSEALNGQIAIDASNGAISAKKGNTIPVGTHTISVMASNAKGEQTTSFTLTIEKNKNFFTYIKYGNNLGLSDTHAYQYRINSSDELASFIVNAPTTDIPAEATSVKWEVASKLNMGGITIDENGALNLSEVAWANARCGMAMVTATTGSGDEEVSVSVPVFFHLSSAVNGVTINYTPFVCQVNPRTGGRSVAPSVEGVADMNNLLMDYRRTFSYYNINGSDSHISGQLKNDGSTDSFFIAQVWRNFYGTAKPNYGAKKPVSYYDNKAALSTTLAYVDPSDKSIVVNPGKWIGEDKVYANGVMCGQITFVTNGVESGINNGSQIFPILLWFDEKF